MTRRCCSEQQIQRAIIDHLRWRGVPDCFYFHCPNGGWRSAVEAAIFKGMGVVPGIPDVFIVCRGRCFALELKNDAGRPTDVQRLTHGRLREAGAQVATVYGIDEAIAKLAEWKLIRGAS
jgi:hypothetical protein